MPTRQRVDLSELASWNNLSHATWKAARGKRHRPDVIDWLDHLDQRLDALGQAIKTEQAPCNAYRSFWIHDPKRRLIHAACFADRVLHHAILNLVEPSFERALVPTSFACRPGKGVHAAIKHVQKQMGRWGWYAQMDIAGYFPSIDHLVLKGLLKRRFKGAGLLALLDRIVDGHVQYGALSYNGIQRPHGLPIGSLTSQHFANAYLDVADRYLLAHGAVRAHVRYMDDIVIWGDSCAAVQEILQDFKPWLFEQRQLVLKPSIKINRCQHGLQFCGARVFADRILLTVRRKRRYKALRAAWEQAWVDGRVDDRGVQQGMDAVLSTVAHTDSLAWRQNWERRSPSRYA